MLSICLIDDLLSFQAYKNPQYLHRYIYIYIYEAVEQNSCVKMKEKRNTNII